MNIINIMYNYKFSIKLLLKHIRVTHNKIDIAHFNGKITHLFSYDKYTEFSWLYISISFWSLLISVVSSFILLLSEKK